MNSFFSIIKSDYLQRTRSYAFLITLCASLAIAYTFVPEPNANYSTIRIDGYVGYYNSAWFGYVTAIMTSVFLSLVGFYLVNSGIKTDIETKVGQIVAATAISNFRFLFSKVLSNFLVLLTIVGVVITMSMLLFFLYNDGYPFEFFQFIKPHLLISVPALFFISALAVIFEVLLGKYSILQNVGFFILFTSLLAITPQEETQFSFDVFGTQIVINQLEEQVSELTNESTETSLNIGYVITSDIQTKKFEFNGIDFPTSFIGSRVTLLGLGIVLIVLVSPVFHRFNIKKRSSAKKVLATTDKTGASKAVLLRMLPAPKIDYGMLPLIKTEALLLCRKGKRWLWLLNIIGMVLLVVLPIDIAHQMVLPVLWFLQVGRLSDLAIKEHLHHTHYFAIASYQPIGRLLVSQLIAAIALMILLAFPLIIRMVILLNGYGALTITLGAIFIVMLAALFGILSKGRKLFEVLYFMITYIIINGIGFVDYFGAFEHHSLYMVQLTALIAILAGAVLFKRNNELVR